MNDTPVLSVVIVSWNTRALLADCFHSLHNGGLEGVTGSEIFVVDNASTDGSADAIRTHFPDVRLLESGENSGFARANNRALRQAKGGYFLLLNPDTLVPRGAIAAVVAAMETDPRVAVVSPLLLNTDGSPQWCWARFPGWKSELSGRLDMGQSPYPLSAFADSTERASMTPFPVDWVGGACFLVRAEAVRTVGLLDEDFFMYAEETDWCRRFRDAGWKTCLVPSVTVTHLGGQSSRAVPAETRARMFRSALRFYRRAYDPVGALLPSLIAGARYALFRLRRERQA